MVKYCDPRPYDVKWQEDLQIPLLIQLSGSTKSEEVFSRRLLYFRIFCAMYCLATMIWSFVRYVEYNMAEYWIMYLTIWGCLMVTFYFCTSAVLHGILSQHIADDAVNLTNYFHSDTKSHSSLVAIPYNSEYCTVRISHCFCP